MGHGSSPLSRGIRGLRASEGRVARIIPALAGNTKVKSLVASTEVDHPRSRGEYDDLLCQRETCEGSSPLSRGILRGVRASPSHPGIIPALAGNTQKGAPGCTSSRDHPRSRGEYGLSFPPCILKGGSSPLSRGIPGLTPDALGRIRIIPALAGNTRAFGPRSRAARDHPRSRGEYRGERDWGGAGAGSSPLSRGILLAHREKQDVCGIIPALAGNTTSCLGPSGELPDHPRSRGEYSATVRMAFSSFGSSPLSRGIPRRARLGRRGGRIIPALAGNTKARN